ncbi:MAG: hypothetical protein IMY72_10120 [Bacteroidetes bacterium]|nr:hypothetical protein [Bacteroidota bacterium]
MKHNILKLLIRSFDKNLSIDKKQLLNKRLESDKNLQNQKYELNEVREFIKKQDYQFKPFFETRVMSKIENIKNELDFISRLFLVYKRIFVFGFSVSCLILIIFYLTGSSIIFDNLFGTNYMNTDNLSVFLMFD